MPRCAFIVFSTKVLSWATQTLEDFNTGAAIPPRAKKLGSVAVNKMNEDELIDHIIQLAERRISSGRPMSPELVAELTDFFVRETQRVGQTPSIIPQGAENLWNLSGSNPEAFTQYLRNFPSNNPELKNLLNNPRQLDRVIGQLQNQMPPAPPSQTDGIPKADLNSSNIYGFAYDPKSKDLFVRFNSGSVYQYGGVPQHIFRIFQAGASPAKTSGQNDFGQWWVGKQPSLGAAFAEYIRNRPFPYERVA